MVEERTPKKMLHIKMDEKNQVDMPNWKGHRNEMSKWEGTQEN